MKAWYSAFSNGIGTLVGVCSIVLIVITGAKHPAMWQVAAAIAWAKIPLLFVNSPKSPLLTQAVLATTALVDLVMVGGCLCGAYAIRDTPTANVLIAALAFVALLVSARGITGLIMATALPIDGADSFDAG